MSKAVLKILCTPYQLYHALYFSIPEWSVEWGGKLGAVAHNCHSVPVSRPWQGSFYRADPTVHHVWGGNNLATWKCKCIGNKLLKSKKSTTLINTSTNASMHFNLTYLLWHRSLLSLQVFWCWQHYLCFHLHVEYLQNKPHKSINATCV